MKYINITKNNDFVLAEDKKHDSNVIKSKFLESLSISKIDVVEFNEIKKSQYRLKIRFNDNWLKLNVVLKNITGAGWESKPKIRRIQVPNFMESDPEFVQQNDNNSINMIVGYYNFDNNPIFVAWEAYRYYNHKTLRSCYISVDSLKRGYEKNFYEGIDSSQKIWIFTSENFKDYLAKYIEYLNMVGKK